MFSFVSELCETERTELCNLIRLFTDEYDPINYAVTFRDAGGDGVITVNGTRYAFEGTAETYPRRDRIRARKKALYKALERHFKTRLPWGALTGIRPTKLAYEAILGGQTAQSVAAYLESAFFVSKEKAELTQSIIKNQTPYLTKSADEVCLYIHIPFCPSRCYYCSFVSQPIAKQQKLVQPYIDALCEEIRFSLDVIARNGQKIHSVYVGGGTPTVLTDAQFKQTLSTVSAGGFLPKEYTVEAGRPDTVTPEKIDLMKRYSVTRVSVNPQSLNDGVLNAIGRAHTADDFFKAYRLTRDAGFLINTDLIAGLADETPADFLKTLNAVLPLEPDNLTVHTLSKKRGSALTERGVGVFSKNVSAMTDAAQKILSGRGYLPYYLYRQKRQLENLENVGYCLPDKQCLNNIAVMEETLSVVACGAGAISKRVFGGENRIERLANCKDVALYLDRLPDILQKKAAFFG